MSRMIQQARIKKKKGMSREKGLNLTEVVKIGQHLIAMKERKDIRNSTVLRSNLVQIKN